LRKLRLQGDFLIRNHVIYLLDALLKK